MSEHEIDRRVNDHAFKLEITKDIAELKSELRSNSSETGKIRSDLTDFQHKFDYALNGDKFVPGLITRSILQEKKLESLSKELMKWLLVGGLAVVIVGNKLSPIIYDWLYQKTHLKIFTSAPELVKEKKATRKVIVRHIHITRAVNDDGEIVGEKEGKPDD
jgi:hypothetical protein